MIISESDASNELIMLISHLFGYLIFEGHHHRVL